MKSLLFVCTTLLLFGLACPPALTAKDTDKDTRTGDTAFIAYEGPQDWPRNDGAMVIREHAVPIYIGLPAKRYRVLGRIYDNRTSGFDAIGRAFNEAFGKERTRMQACANQAKLQGANAVLVTDDQRIVNAFGLTRKELRRSAPLFNDGNRDKIVLAIELR